MKKIKNIKLHPRPQNFFLTSVHEPAQSSVAVTLTPLRPELTRLDREATPEWLAFTRNYLPFLATFKKKIDRRRFFYSTTLATINTRTTKRQKTTNLQFSVETLYIHGSVLLNTRVIFNQMY